MKRESWQLFFFLNKECAYLKSIEDQISARKRKGQEWAPHVTSGFSPDAGLKGDFYYTLRISEY